MALRSSSLPLADSARLLLALLLPVAASLANVGCAPSPPPLEESGEPIPTPSATPPVPALREASEVYVLAVTNAARCLEIARGVMAIYDDDTAEEPRESVSDFMLVQSRPEQATAREVHKIASSRLEQVRANDSQDLYTALNKLVQAEEALCEEAATLRRSASSYDSKVDDAAFAMRSAESEARWLIEVSPAEREEVLAKYRSQLAAVRQAAIDQLAADGRVGDWFDATLDLPYEPLSAEEYAEKKRAWEEEQSRRDRQRLARQTLHREAIESWRSDAPGEARFDIPGVDSEDPSSTSGASGSVGENGAVLRTTAQQQAMQSWYETYLHSSLPARIAIDRYQRVGVEAEIAERLPVCRTLFSTTTDLLTAGPALGCPDRAIGLALRQHYEAYNRVAQACFDDNTEEMELISRSAEELLTSANQELSSYNLEP